MWVDVMHLHKLTALKAARASGTGMLGDGGYLWLQVRGDSKSWIFRYRGRYHGLGPYPTVTLRKAREIAAEWRAAIAQGGEPWAKAKPAKRARPVTFTEVANDYIAAHAPAWRSPKTLARWRSAVRLHIDPVIGKRPVQAIDVEDVLTVLRPIWAEKAETAAKTREILERVLDWCRVRGLREGENPAVWRGNLQHLLPRRDVMAANHHASLPHQDAAAFMSRLRKLEGAAARGLEFTILTACRTSEVLQAVHDEIDGNLWVIPARRMKTGKIHRVPLSDHARAVIDVMPRFENNRFIFAGLRPGRPLSQMSMAMLLRRMGRDDLTVHGFRSTFRTWAAECTDFPREVVEIALAHDVRSSVERAYQRSDFLEKRRALMQDWADFCYGKIA